MYEFPYPCGNNSGIRSHLTSRQNWCYFNLQRPLDSVVRFHLFIPLLFLIKDYRFLLKKEAKETSYRLILKILSYFKKIRFIIIIWNISRREWSVFKKRYISRYSSKLVNKNSNYLECYIETVVTKNL